MSATDDPTSPGGALTVRIADHELTFEIAGGGVHALPVGPLTLLGGALGSDDPPRPASLTNALGLVQDHLDDLLIATPSIAAVPRVAVIGPYAEAMARVEIGADEVPAGYELVRADAEEVFRTLAGERIDDRRHNPGLPEGHVESIIATCCVILGIMRHLELRAVDVETGPSGRGQRTAAG
jgi:exopolyphosphatase/pppGpp-phosphohydrolase